MQGEIQAKADKLWGGGGGEVEERQPARAGKARARGSGLVITSKGAERKSSRGTIQSHTL